jgi:hypothetical protein
MVLFDRSEVCTITLGVYFKIKVHFKLEFFKIASVQVRFSSGSPLGGGFPAAQLHPHGALSKKPVS